MPHWMLRWIFNVLGIIFAAYMIDGFNVTVPGAIVGSIVLGIVNAIIRPIVVLLTLPINVVTLGLFTLVINGFMLWMTNLIVKGFDVTGFWVAVLAALVISIISFIVSWLIKD
ncbi:MAG: phage holin family protein [Syntrophomonadaceae bacterium]|nr:phage holin family protein [Syntrophomonadaceae bacterium]